MDDLLLADTMQISSKGVSFMYFIGIDISKFKHDCCIIAHDGSMIRDAFSFSNNQEGFLYLETVLNSLGSPDDIRIGFEATSHYAFNLKYFLAETHHSFMEINPILISEFKKSTSLRSTKTDTIDCRAIARWLMSADYKPFPMEFYHIYNLKSLTRLRQTLIKKQGEYKVMLTNVLDHVFPEFKPFFNDNFTNTALYLLEEYGTPEKIKNLNHLSYENIRKVSKGSFSAGRFHELKQLARKSIGQSNAAFIIELKCIIRLLKELQKEVESIEKEIRKIIMIIHPHFLTIRGIGEMSAAIIYAEFGNITRFSSPDKMVAFAGLEPGYRQSGTIEKKGRMTKHGSAYLRYALMQCCLPVIRHDMVFSAYYYKKREEGKSHWVAVSHVAKKLIRIIYTLETKGIDYDPAQIR